jgi:hypothetical protein
MICFLSVGPSMCFLSVGPSAEGLVLHLLLAGRPPRPCSVFYTSQTFRRRFELVGSSTEALQACIVFSICRTVVLHLLHMIPVPSAEACTMFFMISSVIISATLPKSHAPRVPMPLISSDFWPWWATEMKRTCSAFSFTKRCNCDNMANHTSSGRIIRW